MSYVRFDLRTREVIIINLSCFKEILVARRHLRRLMRICVKLSVKVSVGINGSVEVLSRGHVPGGKYNLIWLYALWYWSQGDLMELLCRN
ncbi:hypothetical protein F2Q68_00035536 [Brassica cretica]|uniref:Uncharacterized protein n=2 Tax=Brassica cretica TaxID=69181 RepID=A0A8S9GYT5_BRACR|nr:hypothetical protein F2Q68_00035536 [Brassica cretica]KAF3592894.1 hypothetical protein DY000_02024141 [Brassica cretica]